ncbi:hypothetical protein nvc1_046 [Namao virus]|nr:hypothetical protein nvc1_046 [Namao virus]
MLVLITLLCFTCLQLQVHCDIRFIKHIHTYIDTLERQRQNVYLEPNMSGTVTTTWKSRFNFINIYMQCKDIVFDFKIDKNKTGLYHNGNISLLIDTTESDLIKTEVTMKAKISLGLFCVLSIVRDDINLSSFGHSLIYYMTYYIKIKDILVSKTEVMCHVDAAHMYRLRYEWSYQRQTKGAQTISARRTTDISQWKFGQDTIYRFKGMTASYKGCGIYTCTVYDGISAASLSKTIDCYHAPHNAKIEL